MNKQESSRSAHLL